MIFDSFYIFWSQFFIPFFFALSILFFNAGRDKTKLISIAGSSINLIVIIGTILSSGVSKEADPVGLAVQVGPLNSLIFRLDGLSAIYLIIASILFFMAIFASYVQEHSRSKSYYVLLFLMAGVLNIVLVSGGIVAFYFSLELLFLLLFFHLVIFGNEQGNKASSWLVVMSGLGSLLLFSAIIFIYSSNQLAALLRNTVAIEFKNGLHKEIIFWLLTCGLLLKSASFPFHSWFVKVIETTSRSNAIILSGLALIVIPYGLMRFVVPSFKDVIQNQQLLLLTFCSVAAFFSSLLAIYEKDSSKSMSYFVIGGVSIILTCIFSANEYSFFGAVFVAISKCLLIGPLLLGMQSLIEKGVKTNLIQSYKSTSTLLLLVVTGLPFTSELLGKIIAIYGLIQVNPGIAFICGLSFILESFFLMRLYQPPAQPIKQVEAEDSVKTEFLIPALIVCAVSACFFLGLFPRIIDSFLKETFITLLRL